MLGERVKLIGTENQKTLLGSISYSFNDLSLEQLGVCWEDYISVPFI